jgi:2-methylisocitrate lyase-like PEP mutase family enzyme
MPDATPAARLRAATRDEGLVVAPGAFDPFTARIIESLGFGAVYLGGNAMGLHLAVGQPLLTLTEVIDLTRRVLSAVNVPVIVDADAGFGDASHTHRTVREFERLGVAAIHIDDQPFPKRAHYHVGKGRLSSIEEMTAKLGVAAATRSNPDFLIVARTDALRVTQSMADTAKRCSAYLEAGADMLMVLDLGPDTAGDLRRRLPDAQLSWIGGVAGRTPSTAELASAGFSIAVYPFNTVAAITEAVFATWRPLSERGEIDQSAEMIAASRRVASELVPLDAYLDIEAGTTERETS